MRAPPKIKIVQGRPTPSLPVELLNEIFALCSTETQKKLSLLSKAFRQILQPHLFSTYVIRTSSQFEELAARVKASLEFAFTYEKIGANTDIWIRSSELHDVLRRCSGLQTLVVEARQIRYLPSTHSYCDMRSYAVDHVEITPDVISAILDHPSLRTLEFGSISSSWIPSSVASSSNPIQRTHPLLLPNLLPSNGAANQLEHILRFIVERGIDVRELVLTRLDSLADFSLPTLEVLDIVFNLPGDFPFPSQDFIYLLHSYPSLRRICYEGSQEWQVGKQVWSSFGEVDGLQSLATFDMDSWGQDTEFYGFEIAFVAGSDGSRQIEGLQLNVIFGNPPSFDAFLHTIHASFPNLTYLDLGRCSFNMPKVGTLRLPHGLLPNLRHLSLPVLEFSNSSTGLFLSLQSSSCLLHPNPDAITDERAQEVADRFNLAGGPLSYWDQEYFPRLANNIVRAGRAFPRLQTAEQGVRFEWPSLTTPFLWDIERRVGGGVEGVRAILRPFGSGEDAWAEDDFGYCSCSYEESTDDWAEGVGVERWWGGHTFQTPLFDLEPNFFPAFTLDSFFPRIPRTSPPS